MYEGEHHAIVRLRDTDNKLYPKCGIYEDDLATPVFQIRARVHPKGKILVN